MTGALDTRARATAETMIAKFGKAMTLKREVVGTYDATQGTAPVVPVSHSVIGVVSQPSVQSVASDLAQSGDLVVMISAKALSVVPQAGDILLMDSVPWQIITVRSTYSGEEVALYELLTRS